MLLIVRSLLIKFILITSCLLPVQVSHAQQQVLVYAAASTSNAVAEIIKQFNQQQSEIKVKSSFASSSTLAKQIIAGAPAQIIISANPSWMDYLQKHQLIDEASRKNLLNNKLVLISPRKQPFSVTMQPQFNLAEKIVTRLCMGDPDHVPVGIYGKQALQAMNWWAAVKSKVVGSKDVRAALALVERGECSAGIVYATDARISKAINIEAEFPASSHQPIVYPIAGVKPLAAATQTVLQFFNSETAQNVYQHYGFTVQAQE